MKVIVAGSRKFNKYGLLEHHLNRLLKNINKEEIEIVSGCAYGADKLGELYANYRNIKLTKFPAKWELYGKSAGYIRNKEMAEYADALVAFWDGISKGTKHMIDLAKDRGLKIRIIKI